MSEVLRGRPKGEYFNKLKGLLGAAEIERLKPLKLINRGIEGRKLLVNAGFEGPIPTDLTVGKAMREIIGA